MRKIIEIIIAISLIFIFFLLCCCQKPPYKATAFDINGYHVEIDSSQVQEIENNFIQELIDSGVSSYKVYDFILTRGYENLQKKGDSND